MALPKGMTKVVRQAWDDIDDVVTQAILDETDDVLDADSALELVDPDHDMYGCGYWGCAYPTSAKRWAVKISADPFEGPITKGVLDVPHLRDHRGVAYILNIWQLEEQVRWGRSGWRSVWVILREDITPIALPKKLRGRKAALAELLHLIRLGAAAANRYDTEIEEKGRGHGRYKKLVRAEVLWERAMRMAEKTNELNLLSDFMLDFFEEFGARLADVHAGNVGMRRNNLADLVSDHRKGKYWVTFDLGHSTVETGSEVPILRNPADIEVI